MNQSILKGLGIRQEAQTLFEQYLDAVYFKAGNPLGRTTIICHSALEASAFVTVNWHKIKFEDTLFIGTGYLLSRELIEKTRGHVGLVFGRDVLGALWDIKVAGWLNKQEIKLSYDEIFCVDWRNKRYYFEEHELTLSAFERVSGFRSGLRTFKPKAVSSFLEQLKSN